MQASGTDRAALAATAVTVLLWASAFVVIRGTGRYFGPGSLALGRVLAASVMLAVIVALRREGLPNRAAWPGIVGFGVLRFGVYVVALNWGEQTVDAGTASMIVGVGPAGGGLGGPTARRGVPATSAAGHSAVGNTPRYSRPRSAPGGAAASWDASWRTKGSVATVPTTPSRPS